MAIILHCGNASDYEGDADLVFTHPYAPLPQQLLDKPAIINLYLPPGREAKRIADAEGWVGGPLKQIGGWGKGLRNAVYVTRLRAVPLNLTDLVEDPFEPGKGWFPLELPMRVLSEYGVPGITVWDGFCGRGTVGKACRQLGMHYVGMDHDPARIALAYEYLKAG